MRYSAMVTRAFHSLIESALRNIDGGIGRRLRYLYYRGRFRGCGRNVLIDIGVVIRNPGSIEVGDNVWINAYTHLEGGVPNTLEQRILKVRSTHDFRGVRGLLRIGSGVGIGPYNILNGSGGLLIGNNVTTSAYVAVYSHSHYYRDDEDPSRVTYANCLADPPEISCVESPITIADGSWLGLRVSVFGGQIGANSFIVANSVVTDSLPENSYAGGAPARRLRPRFEVPGSSGEQARKTGAAAAQ